MHTAYELSRLKNCIIAVYSCVLQLTHLDFIILEHARNIKNINTIRYWKVVKGES